MRTTPSQHHRDGRRQHNKQGDPIALIKKKTLSAQAEPTFATAGAKTQSNPHEQAHERQPRSQRCVQKSYPVLQGLRRKVERAQRAKAIHRLLGRDVSCPCRRSRIATQDSNASTGVKTGGRQWPLLVVVTRGRHILSLSLSTKWRSDEQEKQEKPSRVLNKDRKQCTSRIIQRAE